MYSDPHIKVSIELTSNPSSSLGTSYAQAEVSELCIFGQALDGKDSDHTIAHVEKAYELVGDALRRAIEDAERRVTDQLAKLRAEGMERAGERELEDAHASQAQ